MACECALPAASHSVAAPDQPVCTLLAAGSGRTDAQACAGCGHNTWTLRLCFSACSASVMARSRLLSPVVNSWWRLDRLKYIALQQAGFLSSGCICGTGGRPWCWAAQLLCANPEQQPTCDWKAGGLPKSWRARACQRCCSSPEMLRPPSLQEGLTLSKPLGQDKSTNASPCGILNGGKLICIANLKHGPDDVNRNVSNITYRQQRVCWCTAATALPGHALCMQLDSLSAIMRSEVSPLTQAALVHSKASQARLL